MNAQTALPDVLDRSATGPGCADAQGYRDAKYSYMRRTQKILFGIGKQILHFAIVLVGITFLTFSIMFLSPKNPAELWLAGADGNVGTISEEAIAEQEHIMGLDRPFLIQYGSWVVNALHGDLGTSFTYGTPVTQELAEHMGPTVWMTFLSLFVSVGISVPAGIRCAVRKDGIFDNIMRGFSFAGISLPSFLLSIIFLWIFCVKLGWFSVLPGNGIRGLILPSMTLALQFTAKMNRQIRAIILEQLEQPYVDGAVSRGIPRRKILFTHVLKNSAAPILTYISIYVGLAFGGSTVIEGIFSVDGLGRMAVSAVARMDIYMIQGFVLWVAVVYLAVNLLADLLSALIDPRIRYGSIS